MADRLPYFKFYASEWINGSITLEDSETQGVFINICAYYWSRECKVTIEHLQKRFRYCEDQVDALFSADLLKRTETHLVIDFLDSQMSARQRQSDANRQNGRKGGRPKKNQMGSDSLSEPKPKQKQYRTEQNRTEQSNYTVEFEFFWKAYPKGTGKRDAFKAFQNAKKRATVQAINAGVTISPQLQRETQYIPCASKWLNGNGWEDAPALPTVDRSKVNFHVGGIQ